MHIHYIEFKNCMSYGNQLQRIDFKEDGLLYLLSGFNGGGKCLSPDTKLNIKIDDPVIQKKFLFFLEKRNNEKIKKILIDEILIKYKDFKQNFKEIVIKNIFNNVRFQLKKYTKNLVIREINKQNKQLLKFSKYGESNINYWILRGWSKEESEEKRKKIPFTKKRSPMCKEFWLEKGFSEEESMYKIKTMRSINLEYWIEKGFSEEESRKKVSQIQKNNSEKYRNKKTKDPKKYYKSNANRVEYWIEKGYSEEESKKIISKRQSRGLSFFKEKYGEVQGYEKWLLRNIKWSNKMYANDTQLTKGYSISANLLFEEISEQLNNMYLFGKKEKFLANNEKIYRYDFTDDVSKKIIEYNGDYWHCNPNTWKEDDIHPIIKKSAKQIWDEYHLKIKLAKDFGYDVMIIWENEVKLNRKEIIKKCIKFLKK